VATETRLSKIVVAVGYGLIGIALLIGCAGSLISGEFLLSSRYSAPERLPLSQAWPLALLVGLFGLVFTVISIVSLSRLKNERD
jgi:hypothetical protein